uniref:PIR Superfamily Protein n=1 Tax=Heterorhabditis bacteriophora TaxID=37862 RepID=A0A1I7WXV3_HETBA
MSRKYSLASDITEENPLSSAEGCLFVCVYMFCVILLICLYEYLMPTLEVDDGNNKNDLKNKMKDKTNIVNNGKYEILCCKLLKQGFNSFSSTPNFDYL